MSLNLHSLLNAIFMFAVCAGTSAVWATACHMPCSIANDPQHHVYDKSQEAELKDNLQRSSWAPDVTQI